MQQRDGQVLQARPALMQAQWARRVHMDALPQEQQDVIFGAMVVADEMAGVG